MTCSKTLIIFFSEPDLPGFIRKVTIGDEIQTFGEGTFLYLLYSLLILASVLEDQVFAFGGEVKN